MVFDYKTQYHHYKRYFLKIRSLSEKPVTQISLALIMVLLTISFFSLFAIKPTATTIAKLIKEVNDSQEVNEKLVKKVESLYQAQKAYQAIESELTYINSALPQNANYINLASKINYLAYNHNLLISSSNFSEFDLINPNPDQNLLNLKLSVAGDFLSIKDFLNDLENLDRLIKINSIHFTDKSEVEGAQIQADISGEVFWLPLSLIEKEKKQ